VRAVTLPGRGDADVLVDARLRAVDEELHMKSIVCRWLAIGALAMALGPGSVSLAQGTPDGVTPADERGCDGMTGAGRGLCIAYCEANDCELDPDSQECRKLRANFAKITGSTSFPCEADEN
jgi:hypothetical protein